VPMFVMMQLFGAMLAVVIIKFVFGKPRP